MDFFFFILFLWGEWGKVVNLQRIVDLISTKHKTKARGQALVCMRLRTGHPPKTLKFVNSMVEERVVWAERKGRRRTRPPGSHSQSAGSL